jgi:hypothetical protein
MYIQDYNRYFRSHTCFCMLWATYYLFIQVTFSNIMEYHEKQKTLGVLMHVLVAEFKASLSDYPTNSLTLFPIGRLHHSEIQLQFLILAHPNLILCTSARYSGEGQLTKIEKCNNFSDLMLCYQEHICSYLPTNGTHYKFKTTCIKIYKFYWCD